MERGGRGNSIHLCTRGMRGVVAGVFGRSSGVMLVNWVGRLRGFAREGRDGFWIFSGKIWKRFHQPVCYLVGREGGGWTWGYTGVIGRARAKRHFCIHHVRVLVAQRSGRTFPHPSRWPARRYGPSVRVTGRAQRGAYLKIVLASRDCAPAAAIHI